MDRKRTWEVGAVAALLLVLVVAGGIALRREWTNRALRRALETNNVAQARQAVRAGADPHLRGSDGKTVLLLACLCGDHALTVTALRCGVEVNAGDHSGFTPLMAAAAYGNPELVRLLLAAGARVNTRDRGGFTALSMAAQFGSTDAARMLKEAGASK
jgi:ankyrin repeat protein